MSIADVCITKFLGISRAVKLSGLENNYQLASVPDIYEQKANGMALVFVEDEVEYGPTSFSVGVSSINSGIVIPEAIILCKGEGQQMSEPIVTSIRMGKKLCSFGKGQTLSNMKRKYLYQLSDVCSSVIEQKEWYMFDEDGKPLQEEPIKLDMSVNVTKVFSDRETFDAHITNSLTDLIARFRHDFEPEAGVTTLLRPDGSSGFKNLAMIMVYEGSNDTGLAFINGTGDCKSFTILHRIYDVKGTADVKLKELNGVERPDWGVDLDMISDDDARTLAQGIQALELVSKWIRV